MRRAVVGRLLVVLCTILGLVSCSDGASEPDEGGLSCSGGCGYSAGWPRVIVGVMPPVGYDGDGANLVTVTGKSLPGGSEFEGNLHMCPESLSPNVICSYSFAAAPSDESLMVSVEDLNGESLAEVDVSLKEFNRCGVDVAYFTVALNADEAPSVSDVRYVTPCGNALD